MAEILTRQESGDWHFQMCELIPVEVEEVLPDVPRYKKAITVMWKSHEALRAQLAAAEVAFAAEAQEHAGTMVDLLARVADMRALAEALAIAHDALWTAQAKPEEQTLDDWLSQRAGWPGRFTGCQATIDTALARPGVAALVAEEQPVFEVRLPIRKTYTATVGRSRTRPPLVIGEEQDAS